MSRELTLSVRTVEMHVSHAYRKLGIRSRAGLARHVLDPGAGEGSGPGSVLEEISPAG